MTDKKKQNTQEWEDLSTLEKTITFVVIGVIIYAFVWFMQVVFSDDGNKKETQEISQVEESESSIFDTDDEEYAEEETEPTPSIVDIEGQVATYSSGIVIANKSGKVWKNCRVEINPEFFGSGYVDRLSVLANDRGTSLNSPNFIPYSSFTKNGKRFNYYETEPESIALECTGKNNQTGEMYFGS